MKGLPMGSGVPFDDPYSVFQCLGITPFFVARHHNLRSTKFRNQSSDRLPPFAHIGIGNIADPEYRHTFDQAAPVQQPLLG